MKEKEKNSHPLSLSISNSPSLFSHLDDQHPELRRELLEVRVVDLAEPAREHDRLDPLPALSFFVLLSAGDAEAERPRVPRDQRLAELVAVVARAIRRVEQDLQRARQVGRVRERRVLGRDRSVCDFVLEAQVADAVARGRRAHHRADARRVRVPDAAPGPGLRSRVGRHRAREVVRLGRQQDVPVPRGRGEGTGAARRRGQQRRDPPSADRRRVVLEADDRVARVPLERLLDQLHQRGGGRLPVQHQLRAEEPVARVLRVGLREVEQLDVGRVAAELVAEQVEVKLDVLVVEGESQLGVDRCERGPALGEQRDRAHRLGRGGNDIGGIRGRRARRRRARGRREALERLEVDLLRHPVVDQRRERPPLLLAERGRPFLHAHAVAPRRLEALDERAALRRCVLAEAGGGADGDGVGRPGRRVGEARPDLDDDVAGVVGGGWLEGGGKKRED